MKKTILTITILALISGFFAISTAFKVTGTQKEAAPESLLTIPDSVNKVLQDKCFDCHHSGSESMKAKMKLKIDKLPTLSKRKLVSKLDGIAESVEKKDMPPKKFLKKYPEQALTDAEAKILIDWANGSIDKIMK
jgi:cytochrome c553